MAWLVRSLLVLALWIAGTVAAAAACSSSGTLTVDMTGIALNGSKTLDLRTVGMSDTAYESGLYTPCGADNTNIPVLATNDTTLTNATMSGVNGGSYRITPIDASTGGTPFQAFNYTITILSAPTSGTTDSFDLTYRTPFCYNYTNCVVGGSQVGYAEYGPTNAAYTIQLTNVSGGTPAFSSTSLTYGTTIGYNTGSASATSIDVATLGTPTNSPTAYYLGSSGTSTTGTSTNGASLSVTTAGVVSDVLPIFLPVISLVRR